MEQVTNKKILCLRRTPISAINPAVVLAENKPVNPVHTIMCKSVSGTHGPQVKNKKKYCGTHGPCVKNKKKM